MFWAGRWRSKTPRTICTSKATSSAKWISWTNWRGAPGAGSWQLMLDSDFALYSPQFNGSDSRDIEASDDDYDGMM